MIQPVGDARGSAEGAASTSATAMPSDTCFDGFKRLMSKIDSLKVADPEQANILLAMSSLVDYAFQAYKNPEGEVFVESTSSGNKIHYFTPNVNEEVIEGVLRVHLIGVTNVPDSDYGRRNLSDPYVCFSCGTSKVRSETKMDTSEPQWNTMHTLVIRRKYVKQNAGEDKINIDLFDEDSRTDVSSLCSCIATVMNPDDWLASAELSLEDVKRQGIQSHQLPMKTQRETKKAPVISFTTEYVPFRDMFVGKLPARESQYSRKRSAVAMSSSRQSLSHCRLNSIFLSKFDHYAFIEAPHTDTQAWIHVCPLKKALIIAFRGTEVDKWKDVLTDLRVRRRRIYAITADSSILRPTDRLKDRRIKVHSGFLKAYLSVRANLLQTVYDVTQWSEEWAIILTGHSLGGALATLCAFEFANRKNSMGKAPSVGVMNYGAPRVGNQAFAERCDESLDRLCFRVIDRYDMVHMVPPFLKHAGQEVLCTAPGNVYLDGHMVRVSTRDTAERVESTDVIPGETAKIGGVVRKYGLLHLKKVVDRHKDENYFRIVRNSITDIIVALTCTGHRSAD